MPLYMMTKLLKLNLGFNFV